MRLRIFAVLSVALFVPAWLPGAAAGHHKDTHIVDIGAETPDMINAPTEHRFTPDEIEVHPKGKVRFTNTDFGPPHTWTLLVDGCDPSDGLEEPGQPEECPYDTKVVDQNQFAEVDLSKLPAGTYTFVCRMGQDSDISLFPPHANKISEGVWEGMVGKLKVPSK